MILLYFMKCFFLHVAYLQGGAVFPVRRNRLSVPGKGAVFTMQNSFLVKNKLTVYKTNLSDYLDASPLMEIAGGIRASSILSPDSVSPYGREWT